MKYIISKFNFILILIVCTMGCSQKSNHKYEESPASEVLYRLIGERAKEIQFYYIPSDSLSPNNMVFEIEAGEGILKVGGNTGVAQCKGAYTYLKEACNSLISWGGSNIKIPETWPDYRKKRVVCPFQYTLQDNICGFGYTTPYYQWEDWLRYLDIMAVHGYNMMLAPIGTEAIWKEVWKKYGFTPAELEEYFTGPAYLPWHRMGNINKHGGPIPSDYFEKTKTLQKKILKHMRSIGIHPVASAFAGFVPKEFEAKFPDAKVRHVDGWVGFKGDNTTHILHPLSPYYKKIGKDFIDTWKKEFGEVDFFLADVFNELRPPVSDESEEVLQKELAEFGNAIYSSIIEADEDATWLMMGWLFMDKGFWTNDRAKALLSTIPDDKMMVLDLYAEASPFYKSMDDFFGKSWMYSIIPNWGGAYQIGGLLTQYGHLIPEIAKSKADGKLKAFGFSPEGTETNEVIYELASDAMWSNATLDYKDWLVSYCNNRYGMKSDKLYEAWLLLCHSIYNKEIDHAVNRIQSNPITLASSYHVLPKADENVNKALSLFLEEFQVFKNNQLYINDLIELATYKYMAIADSLIMDLRGNISRRTVMESDKQMEQISDLVIKIDDMLSHHSLSNLERWVKKARRWGTDKGQMDYYESDAKRIITVWGSGLTEYASRLWSGLLKDYYLARWEAWYNAQKEGEEFNIKKWEDRWINSAYESSQNENDDITSLIEELDLIIEN
ncbi:alpha-N-acetylglucosaminidase [Aestuariivivens marinum]|uniref:alpha-N-acetylglucosaminidase n=1 Tax=Aestuariivivens marinum TaxID=2913555 RepID=UPI001F5A8291|nr:alpha-N-acetylglucosaminidase [Aestuariivivens marinum]